MGDAKDNVAKTAMFFAGFIMLTPHRIAMLCSNHVIKRFHLPPSVVSLFVYKIHNPMELSSLITTILVNLISWMNDATFKAKAINRILSILGAWLMFISSIISYRIFISGGDFGRFDDFYWSVIFMTLMNGFYSNLTFGVNFNSSLYGAGLPSSGFVTFLMHYLYKLLYNIYYWEDYDYTLVIVQYWFSMISLFINAAIWTADQVLQLIPPKSPELSGIGTRTNNTAVKIDIEQKSNYQSVNGGTTENVTVLKVNNNSNTSLTSYTHHLTNNKKMTSANLKKGTDALTTGSERTAITVQKVYCVHVYYFLNVPILICVKKDKDGESAGNEKEYKYYRPKDDLYNPYDDKIKTKWKDITGDQAGQINGSKAPDRNNTKLKNELNRLTGPLTGILFLVMISIIIGSVITGVIISKISSRLLGVSVGLIAYTAVTIILSRDTGIAELFKVPGHWSPILMLGVSMGTVYAFYPSISPYSLVDPDSGKTIDLWIQFSSTIPTYLIAIMDTLGDGDTLKGPGGMFPGIWGEFIDKYGENVQLAVVTLLEEAKNKANTATWTGGVDKKNRVKGEIDAAINEVKAIKTGADFTNTNQEPGQKASQALETVKNSVSGIDTSILAETIKNQIKDPITAAKAKFDNAKANGVGNHKTPDKPANAKNWNAHGGRYWWHYQWFFFILYFLCLHVFISTLHFPDGLIGRYVKDNIWMAGIVGNMFNFVEEWLEAIGFAGGGKQGYGFWNGSVSSFNVLFMLTTVNISMFTKNNPKYPLMVIIN